MTAETLPTLSVRLSGRLGGRRRRPERSFALDVAFTAPARGVTALFGPSGCGKTTVLRCVAGLTRLSGRLALGEAVWQDEGAGLFRPPHRRPIGMVFQDAALFPHLSVRDNLLYGRRRLEPDPDAEDTTTTDQVSFDEAVALLGLGQLLGRGVSGLSGGERQRVAIGRALLRCPRLLLMDEPLSALDRQSKDEILPYLERLHAALRIPVLYVSHDIAEVERLADHLVLMEAGRVRAAGPLAALVSDPALPLSHRDDAAAVLDGRVGSFDPAYGLCTLATSAGPLLVPGDQGRAGTHRRLKIAARDVSLGRRPPVDTSILNTLPARIHAVEEEPDHQVMVFLRLGTDGAGEAMMARISLKSWHALGLAVGDLVFARIKAVALADPALDPHDTAPEPAGATERD